MNDDIVTRLRRQAVEEGFSATDWTELSFDVQNVCDEIERLRKWASYEHAGYCPCAGGNPECVNGAYEVWKSMQ